MTGENRSNANEMKSRYPSSAQTSSNIQQRLGRSSLVDRTKREGTWRLNAAGQTQRCLLNKLRPNHVWDIDMGEHHRLMHRHPLMGSRGMDRSGARGGRSREATERRQEYRVCGS